MPELPEVETVRMGLQKLIVGKTIKDVKSYNPKSFPNSRELVDAFFVGSEVRQVKRRAKLLLVELSTGYTLMVHLKMTGQLVFIGQKQNEDRRMEIGESERTKSSEAQSSPPADGPNPQSSFLNEKRWGAGHPNNSLVDSLPDKSTRVTITFDDESHLYFNDQRKFGWMRLIPSELVNDEPFMIKVGPEPLEPEFTNKVFVQRIRKRNGTTIKAAILDQTTLAGVGNIYADESLWAARIHPSTRVKDLTDKMLDELRKEIVFVLNLSIKKGGSTDRNYVNAEGGRGSYMEFAKVFRLEGNPCPRCGTTIEKVRVAGRGTHICPKCQVLKL